MGRMRRQAWVIMVAAVLALGCFTQRRPISGHDIDPRQVDEIVPNVTTKDQLIARFGKPDEVNEKPGGREELVYRYQGKVQKTTELIVFSKTTTDTERKNLRVLVRNGVVVETSYTNSANPAENRSK